MSVHPSLRAVDKTKLQKSVLKLVEKIKVLMKKGVWQEGSSVFGLPKIKTVRVKIRKEKAAKEATPEAAAAAPGATPTAQTAETPAATKAPSAKGQAK
ncbi:MAG: small basic protein [Candidatus Omnitrophota bacterium]